LPRLEKEFAGSMNYIAFHSLAKPQCSRANSWPARMARLGETPAF
jgi:hypothetical protein